MTHNLEITFSELQRHLDNANSRLQTRVLEINELSEIISTYSAKNLMEQLKKLIETEENLDTDKGRMLICAMWVLHDIGVIQFEKRTDGLAITLQEMILHNKKIIAAKLMSILEDVIEYLSDDTVSIIEY